VASARRSRWPASGGAPNQARPAAEITCPVMPYSRLATANTAGAVTAASCEPVRAVPGGPPASSRSRATAGLGPVADRSRAVSTCSVMAANDTSTGTSSSGSR
jgi:hypothetical protein